MFARFRGRLVSLRLISFRSLHSYRRGKDSSEGKYYKYYPDELSGPAKPETDETLHGAHR